MCESSVYLDDGKEKKLVMEDAVSIENDAGTIAVTDILGDRKVFKGSIEEITFLDHRIVIAGIEE